MSFSYQLIYKALKHLRVVLPDKLRFSYQLIYKALKRRYGAIEK